MEAQLSPAPRLLSGSELPAPAPQAFTSGLRRYLQYYRACVLSTPPTLSLLTIGFLFKKLGRQLRSASVCDLVPGEAGMGQCRVVGGLLVLVWMTLDPAVCEAQPRIRASA